jgi:TPP-dependent pyruvate/acetoin dehydrogenase alpha subunit
MAEMYGKIEGCHWVDPCIYLTFQKLYGGNAIVSSHLPLAVGMAASKAKKDNITCCFFGEGAAAEGEFHEAMNPALWEVPVFVCENNLYAMGTAIRYSHSVTQIEKKGAAYGIEAEAVDGMNLGSNRCRRYRCPKSEKYWKTLFIGLYLSF